MSTFKNCRTCEELVYIPSVGRPHHDCPGMNLRGAEEKNTQLLIDLHDAINRPKGVVPASADEFYNPAMYGFGGPCAPPITHQSE